MISNIFLWTSIFILGGAIGSFIQAMHYRVKHKLPINFKERSVCEHCGTVLGAVELLPFFGYILLRGKSSCCKRKIPIKYPLFELLMGLVFIGILYPIIY